MEGIGHGGRYVHIITGGTIQRRRGRKRRVRGGIGRGFRARVAVLR